MSTGSVYWFFHEGCLYISGSDSVFDWAINLQCWPVRHQGGYVHAGFLRQAKRMFSDLKKHVLGRQERVHTVVGYSLGGALAVLIAEKLTEVQVVTFACPNVGSMGWVDNYPHPVTNIMLNPDPVTGLPPWFLKPGNSISIPCKGNGIKNHIYTLHHV